MLKTHKEIETREIEVIDSIVCNKCGEEDPWGDSTSIEINASWGYGSAKDCTTQQAHVCEKCWDAFCATFTIPVEGYNSLWACRVDSNNEPIKEESPQLSLFTEEQMSGDSRCGFCPYPAFKPGIGIRGYAPCTREAGHDGPCAHPFGDEE